MSYNQKPNSFLELRGIYTDSQLFLDKQVDNEKHFKSAHAPRAVFMTYCISKQCMVKV